MGDLPTWITTIAVGFAAVQLRNDSKSRAKQAAQEAQQAEFERREQARRIWAWAGSYRAPEGEENDYGIVVENASRVPFRDVEIVARYHGKKQRPTKVSLLLPGQHFIGLNGDGSWDFAMTMDEYGLPVRPYTRTDKYGILEIRMTDAAGNRWRVAENGAIADAPSLPA